MFLEKKIIHLIILIFLLNFLTFSANATDAYCVHMDYVCEMRSFCKNYKIARQECATAGNFALCLDVKLNYEKGRFSVNECDVDGNFIHDDDTTSDRCLYNSVRKYFGKPICN